MKRCSRQRKMTYKKKQTEAIEVETRLDLF